MRFLLHRGRLTRLLAGAACWAAGGLAAERLQAEEASAAAPLPVPVVRVAYLVPANRPAQLDGLSRLQSVVLVYREWFRQQMALLGLPAKTFSVELEPDGVTPKVHLIVVPQSDTELAASGSGDRVLEAAAQAGLPIGTPGQLWWLIPETHQQTADGLIVGRLERSRFLGGAVPEAGWVIGRSDDLALFRLDYLTNRAPYDQRVLSGLGPFPLRLGLSFPWFEGADFSSLSSSALGRGLRGLGEAMGLDPDFRNDENFNGNLMGFGFRGLRGCLYPQSFPYNDARLSYGQALALAVSPYFNPDRPITDTTPPQVAFLTTGPVTPARGAVRLTFTASDPGGLAVALLAWDRGDDRWLVDELALTGTSLTRTFTTPYFDPGRTNLFTVTVFDQQGNRHSATTAVVPAAAGNRAPTPFLRVSPPAVGLGETVVLDGASSSDPEHALSLLEFEWDVDGDGVFDTEPTTVPTLTWRYLTPGPRLIRMRVTDPAGAEAVSAPVPIRVTLCPAVLSPPQRLHGYGATTGAVSVATSSQCVWTATSLQDWITVIEGASRTGGGTVRYAVAANPGLTARTGTVQIADQVLTVVQDGLVCAYTLSPTAKYHGAGTNSGSVKVTTKPSCPWQVVNTNDWITLTSGTDYIGTATVSYTLTANRARTSRAGWLLLAGQALSITQWGTDCEYALTPSGRLHDGAGEEGVFNLNTGSACAWTLMNLPPWVTLSSPTSGLGNAVVSYTVAPNPGPPRQAVVRVGGASFTIDQPTATRRVALEAGELDSGQTICLPLRVRTFGLETSLALSLCYDPGRLAFVFASVAGHLGGASLLVENNELGAGRLGLVLTMPAGQSLLPGTQTVAEVCFHGLTAAGNLTTPVTFCDWPVARQLGATDGRTLPVDFADASLTLRGNCTYALGQPTAHFAGAGGTGTLAVAAAEGCPWFVANTNAWISLLEPTNGLGPGAVFYAVAPNPLLTARTGVLAIAGQVFSVAQQGSACTFTLVPTSRVHGSGGESATITLSTLSQCDWVVVNTNSWVIIKLYTNGTGSGTVRYTVFENPNPKPRAGYLTIGGEPFLISQAGGACFYSVLPTNHVHGAGEESGTVSVLTGAECSWTVINTNHWITIASAPQGTGPARITYWVAPSFSGSPRSGTVWLAGQPFQVTQLGSGCSASLSPSSRSHAAGGGTGVVSVTVSSACTGKVWQAVTAQDWITITSGASGTGSGSVAYHVAANTGLARTGVVMVADRPFTLTQAGAPCTYAVAPSGRTHGAGAESGSFSVSATSGCSWTVVNTSAWISVSLNATGVGSRTVSYLVAPNSGPPRTGTLWVANHKFTVSQASGIRTVRAEGLDLPRGQSNCLRILLEAQGNESFLGFSLCFDPAVVSFVAAWPEPATEQATLSVDANQAAQGRVGVSLAMPAGTALGAGTQAVMRVCFRGAMVNQTASSALSFCDQPLDRGLVDEDGLPVPVSFAGSSVRVLGECAPGEAVDAPDLTWESGGRGQPWQCQTVTTLDGVSAAQSGACGNSEYSYLRATVTGPVTVSFWWKVSSEADHDYLRFMVNGADQFRISGEVNWQFRAFDLPAGTHQVQWRYSKNSSSSSGQDRGWLDQVRLGPPPPVILSQPASRSVSAGANVTLSVSAIGAEPLTYRWQWNGEDLHDDDRVSGAATATLTLNHVAPDQAGMYSVIVANTAGVAVSSNAALAVVVQVPLAEALDTAQLAWTSGGAAPWFGQVDTTRDGQDAARSGAIGHSQESWMETTVVGPGTLRFWWKVSSQSGNDLLRLYRNGSTLLTLSGEVDWQFQSLDLGSGTHVLRWRYSKNSSTVAGQDCAWVDQVQWGPPVPLIVAAPVDQSVPEGSTVALAVTASGGAPLGYQWLFNGLPVVNGGNLSGARAATLTFTGVQAAQAGSYAVVVSNALGSVVSEPATLRVLTLPEAVDAATLGWATGGAAPWVPEALVTHDGVDAARSGPIGHGQTNWLQTVVSGPGTLSFWWRVSSQTNRDGLRLEVNQVTRAELSGEQDWEWRTLDLPAGPQTLRWSYGKDSSGSSGQDRGWLDEVVFVPYFGPTVPTITRQPVSQDVGPGASVTFSVDAAGTPPLLYQWRFNGVPLGDTLEVTGSTTPTLTLANAQAAQAGTYSVVVRNDYGLAHSASAALRVLPVLTLAEALDTPTWVWVTGGQAPWGGQTAVTHDWLDAAQSGALGHNQTTWMQTTVQGPGSVSFWWKVSSQADRDRLRFSTNGVEVANISGEVDWRWRVFDLPVGTHILRWAYTKDGSGTAGQDRGWVDQVQFGPTAPQIAEHPDRLLADTGANVTFHVSVTNTPVVQHQWRFNGVNLTNGPNIGGVTASTLRLTNVQPSQSGLYSVMVENAGGRAFSSNATLQVLPGRLMAEALDTTSWSSPTNVFWSSGWYSRGDSFWSIVTNYTQDGVDAMQSGPIPTNGETSVRIALSGPGDLSFWWSVSSQATNDQLRFYLDNVIVARIYGEVPWRRQTVHLPVGVHQLEWRYRKDPRDTSGQDRGWLDQVSFVATLPPILTRQPTSLSVDAGDPASLSVAVTGTAPFGYRWFRNGVPVSNGNGVSGATTATLTIANAQATHAGIYWVTVSNEAAVVTSSNAVLSVSPVVPLGEALDLPAWTWSTGGSLPWLGQVRVTRDGVDAGRSGAIGHGQETWVETTVSGPGTLSFWWKVSSEPNNDLLRFSLNGAVQHTLSGEVDWQLRTLSLPAGTHVLRWRYSKNGSVSAGQDRAWLDQVQFVPVAPAITTPPVSRTVDAGSTVTFTVQATGTPPLTYRWRRNGLDLTDGNGVNGSATATLTLANVQPAQAGAYSVSVANVAGQVTSASALLTVTPLVPLAEALDTPGWTWTTGGHAPWVGHPAVTHDGVDAARSGPITHSQESWMETTVTGPGTLSFWWKVSSQAGSDLLRLYVNGSVQATVSGEVDWQGRTLELPAGNQVLRWRYSKNGSTSTGQDRGWVDQVQFIPGGVQVAPTITGQPPSRRVGEGSVVTLNVGAAGSAPLSYQWRLHGTNLLDEGNVSGSRTASLLLNGVRAAQAGPYTVLVSNAVGSVTSAVAVLTVDTLGEAVDAPELSWRGAGDASWIAQTAVSHDGVDAARSGVITHGQNTRLETRVLGPGLVSFWWRVSSEAGHDQLRFYVGSNELARISGEIPWQFRTFEVPAGDQLLKWRYSKNESGTGGQDVAWVDEIRFGPSATAPAGYAEPFGAAPDIQIVLEKDGRVHLRWQAVPGTYYQVQSANNLVGASWTDLGEPVRAGDASVAFWDPEPRGTQRFYRVLVVSP